MARIYKYCLFTPKGKKVKGCIQAESLEVAGIKIREQGNIIISLKPQGFNLKASALFRRRMTSRMLMLFFRQISVLLSSSMSLSDSLEFLTREERKPGLALLYSEIHHGLCGGASFSEMLRHYPALFPPAVIAVIQAGETSGHMSEALAALTVYLEQRQKIRESVLQATLYPALLILVSALVIAVLMTFVVPAITGQLVASRVAIPWSTALLMAVSDFLSRFYPALIAVSTAGIFLFRIARHNARFRLLTDSVLLRLPLIGRIISDAENGLLLITLNLLTSFSVPVLDAFMTVRTVVSNSVIRKNLESVCEYIHEGKSICSALHAVQLFDETTMALLRSGERSGEFQRMVNYSSELLNRETTTRISASVKTIEPLLILFIGLIVLFIFLSIMQPMLDLNNITL